MPMVVKLLEFSLIFLKRKNAICVECESRRVIGMNLERNSIKMLIYFSFLFDQKDSPEENLHINSFINVM